MPGTTLVVDDDRDIALFVVDALTFEGYPVACVYTGEDALNYALVYPPALILLDLWLPGWDGWETRRQLLAHDRTADVPVVLMTAAQASPSWREDLQAAALLRKPFGVRDLTRIVTKIIGPP